jgi:hypothetical protein
MKKDIKIGYIETKGYPQDFASFSKPFDTAKA